MARHGIASAVIVGLLSTAAFAAPARSEARDVTTDFLQAGAVVDRLQVYEVGGIIIIRGRTADKSEAENAGLVAKHLGYSRVANLVQITEPADDSKIERQAERALSENRSMDGSRITVEATKGIVHLGGVVAHELQKDLAIQLVRNINGVSKVESTIKR